MTRQRKRNKTRWALQRSRFSCTKWSGCVKISNFLFMALMNDFAKHLIHRIDLRLVKYRAFLAQFVWQAAIVLYGSTMILCKARAVHLARYRYLRCKWHKTRFFWLKRQEEIRRTFAISTESATNDFKSSSFYMLKGQK